MTGSMSFWRENTPTIITIIAEENTAIGSIEAFYKKRGSAVAFTKFTGEFVYKGHRVWELLVSLPIGEYIIYSTIGDEIRYAGVKVLTPDEFTHTVNQELIREDIENLLTTVNAIKTFKVV